MLENLKQRGSALGSVARLSLAVAAVAVIAVCLALAWRFMAPDYQVLFSDLDAQDAAAIVAELERLKVAHRLQDEGRTVLVDRDDVHRTRLKLMSKGVNLRGTVGFELFSDADFGMTEFAQKINYQRAMQGELARTIMALEEVRAARVHLVIPESGLLHRGESHGKASITITTRPGKRLQAAQVAGIQRLVAAAVPQIEPAAVTVLDSRGLALSVADDGERNGDAPGMGASEARLELKRQMESYLTSKAAAVLDRAVGRGRAIVSVDAILHQDAIKVTEEKVLVAPGGNGEGAIVRSRQTSQSESRTASAAPAAAVTQSADRASGPAPRNESSINEVEFQHGRRIEQMVSAPGAIKRLSVGIVLPETLPAPQVQKLTEVVSMAVGLNPGRGDGIAVYSLEAMAGSPRDQAAAPAPAPALERLAGADSADAELAAASQSAVGPGPAPSRPARPAAPIDLSILLNWTLAALALAALLAVCWWLWRRLSLPASSRLSEAERARILRDIQHWLAPGAQR